MSLLFSIVKIAEAEETFPALTAFMDKVYKAILNPLIVLLFVLAFLYFLIGMLKFFMNKDGKKAGDLSSDSDGRRHMLWGIIGMFIMISVFGIIEVIRKFVGA